MTAGLHMLRLLSFGQLRFYVSSCVDVNVCGQICKWVCLLCVCPQSRRESGSNAECLICVALSTRLFSLQWRLVVCFQARYPAKVKVLVVRVPLVSSLGF